MARLRDALALSLVLLPACTTRYTSPASSYNPYGNAHARYPGEQLPQRQPLPVAEPALAAAPQGPNWAEQLQMGADAMSPFVDTLRRYNDEQRIQGLEWDRTRYQLGNTFGSAITNTSLQLGAAWREQELRNELHRAEQQRRQQEALEAQRRALEAQRQNQRR